MTSHWRLFLVMVTGALVVVTAPAIAQPADEPVPAATPAADEIRESEGSEADVCDEFGWSARAACAAVGTGLSWGLEHVVLGTAQAALRQVVEFVVEGAVWLLGEVVSFIDTSTRPDVTADWFRASYQDMALIGLLGLLPFLLLAVIQGLIRQNGGMLARAAFVHVPVAVIGTAGAIVVVDLLVQLTDNLSLWIARSFGSDLTEFARNLGAALMNLSAPVGSAVAGLAALLAALLIAFASFVIWLELLLRQAAIYVAVLFLPLGFMALVWPATSHWLRRLVQGLVAVILSKFVIVAVMALAASALGTGAPQEGFGVVISGGAMLSLAALAPYVLLRIIPVFESSLAGDLEGTYRRPTAAVGAPHVGSRMPDLVRQRTSGGTASGVPWTSTAGSGAAAGGAARSAPATAAAAGAATAGTAAAAGAVKAAGSRARAQTRRTAEAVTTGAADKDADAPPRAAQTDRRPPPPPDPVTPPPSEPDSEGGGDER